MTTNINQDEQKMITDWRMTKRIQYENELCYDSMSALKLIEQHMSPNEIKRIKYRIQNNLKPRKYLIKKSS